MYFIQSPNYYESRQLYAVQQNKQGLSSSESSNTSPCEDGQKVGILRSENLRTFVFR